MPIQFQIYPRLNVVVVTHRGVLTLSDQIKAMRAYAADPLYSPGQHSLMDMSDCTMDEYFFDEIQRLAEWIKRSFPERSPLVRQCYFATQDNVYALNRMLQTMLATAVWKIEVISNRAEALDWLRLDSSKPEYAPFRARWLHGDDLTGSGEASKGLRDFDPGLSVMP